MVSQDSTVALAIPATARHLRLVRLTASGMAAELGFTLDQIEDLRLAVDEACAVLIEHADGDARLELAYSPDGSALVIEGRCPSADGNAPQMHAVARAILDTTIDEHEVSGDGTVNAFRLVKRGGR